MNASDPFAGLDRRVGAYLLDIALLYGLILGLQFGLWRLTGGFPFDRLTTGPLIEAWVLLTVSMPVWLYFFLLESSPRGASLGKRLLGLKVSGLDGESLSRGRTLLRTLFKLLPWELTHVTILLPVPWMWDPSPGLRPALLLVYLLLGLYLVSMIFTPRKQSLYDLLLGSVVIRWPLPPANPVDG